MLGYGLLCSHHEALLVVTELEKPDRTEKANVFFSSRMCCISKFKGTFGKRRLFDADCSSGAQQYE